MPYEYKGPGVTKPHPRKGHFNPEARPVTSAPRGEPRLGSGDSGGGRGRSPVQLFAAATGLIFLLVGIAGFIPGVTTMYDQLEPLGTDSRAELLDLFRVSILHNVVHLLFAVGLLAAAKASWSKLYLLGGGIGYLVVAAYGFLVDEESDANFLPVNDADNLLHVGLSLLMIALGLVGIAAERRGPTGG